VNGVLLLGPKLRERFESELVELGYIIHAVETVASIDDIAAALLELRRSRRSMTSQLRSSS
jgi:hypothetical protein